MLLQTAPTFNTAYFVIVGSVVILFFIIFFYLFIVQLHRRRILHQKEMFDLRTQYEQTILKAQLEIQEQTFRNISQEIHDNIGQVLSLAKLNLNTIQYEAAAEKVAITEELLGKAIGDLRDLSKSLNTEKITDIGLAAAIKHELNLIEKAASMQTSFTCNCAELYLSPEQTIVVFRMIQESFNNILKHAKATQINIDIDADVSNTKIKIADNGCGFDTQKLNSLETGIGLKSIKQRAELIGGSVNLLSQPGQGTTVQIHIHNNKSLPA
ncbi:sensor histidine kinase [Foetidibacter luteolus]|uniref:sensor histidine kinase n=1 Tax=Foetidibacter luteolus TaxID=2608880 RepID=UPI00129AB494|nr:sensor histidine kinase [Foetidibacter luteolus]